MSDLLDKLNRTINLMHRRAREKTRVVIDGKALRNVPSEIEARGDERGPRR